MTQPVEINLRPIFSTPFLVFSIPGCERINIDLCRVILERETSTPAHTDYEVVGWSSPHDLSIFDWAGDALKGLFECVVEVAAQATEFSDRTLQRNTTRPSWQVAEIWANVQRKGGSNAAHPHPGTFWSGVYYVDVGDVSTDNTRGGELKLFDPRGCLPKMLAPYLRYSMPELYDAGTSISFYPEAGQCVMFPGWLSHAVATYTGDAPRISVAFNLDPLIRK